MKKLLIKLMMVVLASFFLITLALGSLKLYWHLDSQGFFMTKEEKYFYQKLKEFRDSGKEIIELKKLTNFAWDFVVFYPPYGGFPDRKAVSKFKLSKKLPSSSDSSFIFFNQQDEIGYIIDAKRNIYGFNAFSNDFFNSDEAKLRLKITKERQRDCKFQISKLDYRCFDISDKMVNRFNYTLTSNL